jgi:hypothetical protein
MIVDVRGETVDVQLFFEFPQTERQKEILDYILDQLMELESDYNENTN